MKLVVQREMQNYRKAVMAQLDLAENYPGTIYQVWTNIERSEMIV